MVKVEMVHRLLIITPEFLLCVLRGFLCVFALKFSWEVYLADSRCFSFPSCEPVSLFSREPIGEIYCTCLFWQQVIQVNQVNHDHKYAVVTLQRVRLPEERQKQ